MTPADSGLGAPPDDADLRDLPRAEVPTALHRLSEWRRPWWFSSADPDEDRGGRFDLPEPDGTCHLAHTLEGALLEKLLRRPKRAIPASRLTGLFHATIAVRRAPAVADLTAPGLSGLGLNAEVHTTLDYRLPRLWAARVRDAGWKGLRYLLRSDVAGREHGVAMFGSAGLHARAPAGMRTSVATLDRAAATSVLEERGVTVRPIPRFRDVPVAPARRTDE